MNSREAAVDFVERLKAIVDDDEIRLHLVKFFPEFPDLYDVEVTHDDWGMTLSLDQQGETLRLLLDGYVIEKFSPPEVLEFIAALVAGRALVRVTKVPIFGRFVNLDVDLGSSRPFSTRRRWGSGLASWEHRLLEA
jgi:hypothetical protein